jgi:hypothetical protein
MRQLPITRILLSLLLLCATARAADSVAAIAEAYAGAKASDAVSVDNLRVTAGHMTLVLQSGKVAKVTSGSRTLGFYFKGTGTFTYQSRETMEFPVMKFNLKRTDFVPRIDGETATIGGRLDEAIVWTSQMPELGSTPSGSLVDAFAKYHGSVPDLDLNPVLLAVVRDYEAPASPVSVMELASGKDHLIHRFDPLDAHEESLTRLYLEQSSIRGAKNYYYQSEMSNQATDRTRRDMPHPRFLVTDLTYNLANPSGEKMILDATETLLPASDGEKALTFRIEETFYKRTGTVFEPRQIAVTSVKDDAGNALSTVIERGRMIVGLAQPTVKNQPIHLKFHIEGDNLIGPGGDTYWLADGVFPMPDELAAQYYTVHSTISTRKPNVPLAPGDTVSRRVDGEMNVLESTLDKPSQFTFAMGGHYTSRERTENGLTVRVHTYALTNDQGVKKLTDLAFGIIKYYEYFLGPFPYKEFNIIQINSYGFGVAPPATMWITNEAFRPLGDEDKQETNDVYSEGINERFAHEIAHQYWGHNAKAPSSEEAWLSESFAEYTAALFLKKAKGESTYNKLVNEWKVRASQAKDTGTIPTSFDVSTPGDSRSQFAYSTGLRYFKGAYILSRIHKEIGDQQFLTFMKSYQANFRGGKFGRTQDVIGILGVITKKDWKPYFEQYYWGTAMPE